MQVNNDNVRNKRYITELDDNKKRYYNFLKMKGLSDCTLYNYKNLLNKIESKQGTVNPNIPVEQYNFDEIIELLKEMQPISERVARTYNSFLMDYFKFLIKEKILPENMLVLNDLTRGDFVGKIIDKRSQFKQYVSERQIYEAVENLVNPQDKAIILLQFEGIQGKSNIDLISILCENIDVENKTIEYVFHKTGELKVLKMNDILAEIIEDTLQQEFYINANNRKVSNSVSPLLESPYLIKPTQAFETKVNQTKKPHENQVYGSTIQQRTRKCIQNFLDLNNQQVTPKSLFWSGILNRAVKYSVNNYFDIMSVAQFVKYLEEFEDINKITAYHHYEEFIQIFNQLLDDIIE